MRFLKFGVGKAVLFLWAYMKLHYFYMCAKKVYNIFKAQNTLVKPVYYIVEYTICSLICHLCAIFIQLFLRTFLPRKEHNGLLILQYCVCVCVCECVCASVPVKLLNQLTNFHRT